MNVLLLTSHSIAEYDDLRMLTDLGYDVFSIGAYTDPRNPTDDKRPALDLPDHEDLAARCRLQRQRHEHHDASYVIDWAKGDLHPDVVDWADVIIVHHFPERWIGAQWGRIRHKRVVWRTCGQSGPDGALERVMAQFYGLEIVRYSPNERVLPNYAGESALIRFGKYPADYGPWTGDWFAFITAGGPSFSSDRGEPFVANVTQHMAQRGSACGYDTWRDLTAGLVAVPAGAGSEDIGGTGLLSYEDMLAYLRGARAYLYTGTHPASYTLGLMEAMLSGIPTVTVAWNVVDDILYQLYEAPAILPRAPVRDAVPGYLATMLADHDIAARHGQECRDRAIELFDVATVGPQWKAFLG